MVDTRLKEERLVLAAQGGNKAALDVLYRLYQPSLLRFAYKICANDAASRDAVQDAWVMSLQSLKNGYPPSAFRARIFQAVKWRMLDYLRRQNRFTPILEEDSPGGGPELVTETHENWATGSQLRRLIKSLPDDEGEAVYLFYLEELTVAEIAVVQKVPAGTVKSRLSRARGRLADSVKGEHP